MDVGKRHDQSSSTLASGAGYTRQSVRPGDLQHGSVSSICRRLCSVECEVKTISNSQCIRNDMKGSGRSLF